MAREKNGEGQLLACLKIQGELGPRPIPNSLSFPSAVGKKWKGELMEENFRSSHFCDDHTTNSLE